MNRIFRNSTIIIAAIVIVTVAAVFGGIYWKGEALKKRFIREFVERIQPQVPFQIESVTLDADWKNIRSGQIPQVRIALNWPELQARAVLIGPLIFDRARVDFRPTLSLSVSDEAFTPVSLMIEAIVASDLSRVESLTVNATIPKFQWKSRGVEMNETVLNLSATRGRITIQSQTKSADWADPAAPDTRLANLSGFKFAMGGTYAEGPLRVMPQFEGRVDGGGLELLHDRLYLDLPLFKVPLSFTGDLSARTVNVVFPRGEFTAHLPADETPHVDFSVRRVPLTAFIETLKTSSPLAALTAFQWKAGTISVRGRIRAPKDSPSSTTARVEALNLGFTRTDLKVAVRGLNLIGGLTLKGSEVGTVVADVGIAHGRIRKLDFAISPTRISLRDRKFSTAGPLALRLSAPLPIALDVGQISGSFETPADKGGRAHRLQFKTSLRLGDTPLGAVLAAACIRPRGPDVKISADFPEIEVTNSYIDFISGTAKAKTLSGEVVVRDIGFFDLDTPVVETYFGAEWSGLRLDQLGDYLHFGKMDGLVQGHARGVVLVSWLPTQYDFLVEVKPHRKRDVVFSPDAMRNFVKTISGYDIDELPGILNWFIFKWPSRLLGGYDVNYAGISLYARDGSILLETLDPPKVVASEGKHFILYGGRFKMPLRSSNYPVVLDTTGVGNFAQRMIKQLETISKKTQDDRSHTLELPESDPCFAPRFEDLSGSTP